MVLNRLEQYLKLNLEALACQNPGGTLSFYYDETPIQLLSGGF